jgi:hypothetical protein
MKRAIFSVAAGLAFVSATVSAQSLNGIPQPSFNDNAPVQYGPSSFSSSPILATRNFPKPSFNDNAPIPYEPSTAVAGAKPGEASTGGGGSDGHESKISSKPLAWPQPSFNG